MVNCGGKEYPVFDGCVSAAKNGLIYMGMQAADYGDTFVYNVSADAYQDTGYQYFTDLYFERVTRAIAVGDTVYAFYGGSISTAKACESALFPIQVKKNAGGTVSGLTEVLPGNDAVLEVKAKKGYVIKSIQVDSKQIAVDKNAAKKTVTIKNVVKAHAVKVVFEKKTFSITLKKNAGGTVSGPKKVQRGGSAAITVKAKKGYVIKSIKVDQKTIAVKKHDQKDHHAEECGQKPHG